MNLFHGGPFWYVNRTQKIAFRLGSVYVLRTQKLLNVHEKMCMQMNVCHDSFNFQN